MRAIYMQMLCLSVSASLLFACGESEESVTEDATLAEGTEHAGHHARGGGHAPGHASIEGKTKSDNGLYLVKVAWLSEELSAGTLDNKAKVHFNNLEGEHVPASLKSFKLFMVSMGHGSTRTEEMTLTALDEAHWQVENVYFSMGGAAGSWAVDIEAEVNGQIDKARVLIDKEVK